MSHTAMVERAEGLSDADLVEFLFGLLGEANDEPGWGLSPEARMCQRVLFGEIAARWIPPDVVVAALAQLLDEEMSDDALRLWTPSDVWAELAE